MKMLKALVSANRSTFGPPIRTRRIVMGACLLLLVSLGAWPRSGQQPSPLSPNSSELLRNVGLLRDLEAGNAELVRQKLMEDSMERIVFILDELGYTTNKDSLYSDPSLRAASKYWGSGPLPQGLLTLELDYPVVSNRIAVALATVATEQRTRAKRGIVDSDGANQGTGGLKSRGTNAP
ncbi:MAG: hypothetical protein C5B50_21770 [Verrucomicrobia bacterium]|nr:MAG: hypothetical protein C5B50_21770 [Verrucomicrobiota bacterium]